MLSRMYVLIDLNGDWIPCGLLKYQEAGPRSSSLFRYGKKYLARADAISIDPVHLPLEDRSFETPDGFQVFNGIRDAGPDKWGRYLLDKKFARGLNEIEYIAATGEDRVGALAFTDSLESGPMQYEPGDKFEARHSPKRLDLTQCAGAVDDAVASDQTKRLKQYLDYGPSLGGARPKSTVMWHQGAYLAKFSISLDSKNEPLIEYATMTLAQKCGLNLPPLYLEKIGEKSVFLIKRFDRKNRDRIPFISGLTITGTHESDYGSWSYFALADAILRFSEHPEEDLKELFRRLVFNIAVYNNDDHPRNFGFLNNGKYWNLSPLYDVSPAVIKTDSYALAMVLGADGRRASYKNALSLCEKFRLSKAGARLLINNIRDITTTWKTHFSKLGVSDAEIAMLENSFKSKD
ncbi:MAG: type II toxin-antitoxin system HipA family toxin [Deltaproteobacteria bacterium]|nr:type II toxin-antitoxin system HipA family toxin [Deltaproteobacteria bacterium]